MNTWPTQKECKKFYGNPLKLDLVRVEFPWICRTSWDNKLYMSVLIHKKCSVSLAKIFWAIWAAAGQSRAKISEWGLDRCGGTWVVRPMTNGTTLSMHAYGCAIDFDPVRNGFGNNNPNLLNCPEVLKAFKDEGWVWGGDWHTKDGMHFQAALTTNRG